MKKRWKKKLRIVLTSLALCAAVALAGLGWAGQRGLEGYRAAARYSAQHAFEETVAAVGSLSDALGRCVYATDEGLRARICSEAFASAAAAESAMSVLPFATQELEQLSGFLNVAGDYAYSLCGAAAEGLSGEQRENLRTLARAAEGFLASLRALQADVDGGEVRMDSREKRLQNVGQEDGELLSARLLGCEADFEAPEKLLYDGKFGCAEEESGGWLTEDGMRTEAARFAGVEPEALDPLYEYAGSDSRRCYRTGDLFVCVSRRGVESMVQSRLVSEALMKEEEALELAQGFLEERGFTELALVERGAAGAVASFVFAREQDGALCRDNTLRVSVALDDGSVYRFSAEDYSAGRAQVNWRVGEEEAAAKLPEGLQPTDSRRVILKSPGGRDVACYAFACADGERAVTVYVDADTGEQFEIEL